MMVAQQSKRFLGFFRAQSQIRPALALWESRIVIRIHITGLGVVIGHLEENAVLGSDLLFEAQRGGELVEIVVRALAVFRAVVHLGGVTEVSINAVLRRALNPVAPAQILGLGIEAEAIALEEFGVILRVDI